MILAVLLMVADIAPPCVLPYAVRADDAVPEEARLAAIKATLAWNEALGRRVFEWRFTGHADIVVAVTPGDKYLGYWDITAMGGCALGGVVLWYEDQDRCPDRDLRILIHELGHALGLYHEDSKYGEVMKHLTPKCGADIVTEISPELAARALEVIDGVDTDPYK